MRLRSLNLVWAFAFIVPTWLVFARPCRPAPVDAAAHAVMFLHARLPEIVAAAILASAALVAVRLARTSSRLATLRALGSPMPPALAATFAREAERLRVAPPAVTYLDVATPVCCSVAPGATILLSRGFLDGRDDAAVAFVVRHELLHVRRRDALRALLWHLAFAALLVPGFSGLERWLYDRRERHTNALAADPALDVATRTNHRCDPSLGRVGRPTPTHRTRGATFVRPALAAMVFAALVTSHRFYVQAMPLVDRHHC